MIIWLSLAAIAAGAAFYFLYWKKRETTTEPGSAQPAKFPIKKGETRSEVKAVQNALNAKHNAGVIADGILGQATLDAMTKFYNPGKPFPHLDEFWFKAITK